ncbi:MAG: hypothetical protein OEY49_03530 [Candidatus Heimdallarchaeota archaeon]|nr:hypothetical protein [Candidatus Heimdallarchaeota archaeon]
MATCEKCNQNEGNEYRFMMAGSSFKEESGHKNFYDVREGSGVICMTCINRNKTRHLVMRTLLSVLLLVIGFDNLFSFWYAGGGSILLGIALFVTVIQIKNEDVDKSGQRAIMNVKKSSFEEDAKFWTLDDFASALARGGYSFFDVDKKKITSKNRPNKLIQ